MARTDLVVIGGGTAGLVAAVGAAGQGARTVLIERERTGGDCLWTGCVPSKALISAADSAHTARTSGHLGVHAPDVTVDFAAVMAHVKRAIGTIEPHDSPERLRSQGVEVIHGDARFVGTDVVEVAGRRIRFHRALIATGAAPIVPPIPGLADVGPLTNEAVWDLSALPERLVVLGGGAIGCELGQAFGRLGSEVHVVEMADRLLPSEEPEASQIVSTALRSEGGDVRVASKALRVETDADGHHLVIAGTAGESRIGFDRILVAVGRSPRTAGLGLDRAVTAADTAGFARLVGDDKGRLVGATVVGPRAGETIGEVVAWMTNDAKVQTIARSSTHAYPTWNDDLSAASLLELRAALAKLKPLTRILLTIRRLLDRPDR